MRPATLFSLLFFASAPSSWAELKVPAVFGDNMVLQQKQEDPIWGWDAPGTKITVSFGAQLKTAEAHADGKWTVRLDPMPANATPQTLKISGSSSKEIQNVLVGEVWLCSGQSNMSFTMDRAVNAEVEAATMKYDAIRLLTVPNVASQTPLPDFQAAWQVCSPETCLQSGAVGLYFGRYLHQILGVPVGLINNAWGGSNIESWVKRSLVECIPQCAVTMARCKKLEDRALAPEYLAKFEKDDAQFKVDLAAWKAQFALNPLTDLPRPRHPKDPRDFLEGNLRVANLYNGVLCPLIGYGIKGVIWYQGESNIGKEVEYASLFPTLIQEWRREWRQDDFPFYWVQLPSHGLRTAEPPPDSEWARLRAAQASALTLPHTGQAVTIDIGVAEDLHPKNKVDVAARLVRWALMKDYGKTMSYRNPEFKYMTILKGKVTLTFDYVSGGLEPLYGDDVKGFAICGADHKWYWGDAAVTDPDKVIVSHKNVPHPIAIRYGWADNSDCNLVSPEGLPLLPFRTDYFDPVESEIAK